MWTLNFELLPADTQVCFLSCCQVQTWAVSLAVLVWPRQPHMTLAVAAAQSAYSPDREALSDKQ